MYKAVIKHAYDAARHQSNFSENQGKGGSGNITWSDNKSGNQAHDSKTGKFTFNPNKAANISKAISTGARNASQNLANNSSSYLRGKKGPRADLSHLSDQELRRILNREQMELDYDRYFNTPVESKGKKFVDGLSTVLGITATAAGIAGTAFSIYAIAKSKK